jgi:hypothetical protein
MKTWTELLSRPYSGPLHYGPRSAEVVAALWALKDIPWFRRVGQSLPADANVTAVASWKDACEIFDDEDGKRYNCNGHLVAVAEPLELAQPPDSERHEWWRLARKRASGFVNPYPAIPSDVPAERRDFIDENALEFASMLLAEIIDTAPPAPPAIRGFTYFREQLQWFYAGHFPCGWDGEWPSGRMRVF